jgi:hypothetical protein
MVLYLDFDGVLHADAVYRTKKGIVIKGGATLFEHCAIVDVALEQYPEVKIVLSTSWVRELGFSRAKERLLPSLQSRVIGATYHSDFERDDFAGTPWWKLTRYEQIARHVERNKIVDWLAVDNDNKGWPENQNHRLVLTQDELGLGEVAAQQRLADALNQLLNSR